MGTRNNGTKTGRRADGTFEKGNPGRPRGARHRVSVAVEALLEGEAEQLTRKAIEKAKEGDMTALRLCLDRIAPPRRDAVTAFALPPITGADDHPQAVAAILRAVAAGELAPSEGEALCRVIGEHRKAVETADIERRLTELEART